MVRRVLWSAFGLMLLSSLVASAEPPHGAPKPDCAATPPAALPAELAGWSARGPLAAAAGRGEIAGAALLPGKAVDAALQPVKSVHYVTNPGRSGGADSFGGMFALDVKQAGTYRVAIGNGAWIDIVQQKQTLKSTAHAHGPACSGIGKMVAFPLEPGHYVVQLSGSADASLPLLVTRLP